VRRASLAAKPLVNNEDDKDDDDDHAAVPFVTSYFICLSFCLSSLQCSHSQGRTQEFSSIGVQNTCLQCFDAIGWETGRASGL